MTLTGNLDPRTKIFLIACLSSSAVFINHWVFLTGILVVSLLLLALFRVSVIGILKRTKGLVIMVVVIALMQSIFVSSGEALITIGGIRLVTTGGLMMAAEFVLRMLIIVASAGILSTSDSREIIQGLVQWKLPYEIAFMASMGIRFLPVFTVEFKDAMVAIQLRGVDLKALKLKQKIEVYACLFQPVVAGALIKSKAISMSIEMRGFRAYPTRTSYLILKLKPIDYVIMVGAGILTIETFVFYLLIGRFL